MCWAGGQGPALPAPQEEVIQQALPRQVDVIKKAYLQEEERENSDVSPREVGHNIYILALQVPAPPPRALAGGHAPQPLPMTLLPSQLSRHNKQLQHLLKPVKRIQEEEAEGISSMVGAQRTVLGVGRG